MLVKRAGQIETLVLARNSIGPQGGIHFARVLRSDRGLKMLHLEQNGLGAVAEEALAEAIFANRQIQLETFSGVGLDKSERGRQWKARRQGAERDAVLTNKQVLGYLRDEGGASELDILRKKVVKLEAEKRADQKQLADSEAFPTYWEQVKGQDDEPAQLKTGHMQNKLQHLLRSTIFEGHEDGCQQASSLANAEVLRVDRLENAALWTAYIGRRRNIITRGKGKQAPLKEQPVCLAHNTTSLDKKANEQYLFHGVKKEFLPAIFDQGLDSRLAANTGLYGEGIYFAENSCKSHRYTGEPADGVHCMLYCRVALGKVYTTKKTLLGVKRPAFDKAGEAVPGGKLFDSVVAPTGPMADHQNGHQVHREFVVFDRSQVYPEFCVYYKIR